MNNNPEHKLPITEASEVLKGGLWDIRDVSAYLKVKIKTIYTMVPDMPHYRVGKLIRFKQEDIDAWLKSKRNDDQDSIRGPRIKRKQFDNINTLIRKTIDRAKQEDYNSSHGKSDRIKTQQKEMDDGSI